MTDFEIIKKVLEQKRGTYVKLTKFKDLGEGYSKETDMIIRTGIDYYNMEENKNKPRQGLTWGSYVKGLEGYVIQHVDKKTGEPKYYLRVYDNGTNIQAKSKFFRNGTEITKEEALLALGEKKLASQKSSCYAIDFKNIIKIG